MSSMARLNCTNLAVADALCELNQFCQIVSSGGWVELDKTEIIKEVSYRSFKDNQECTTQIKKTNFRISKADNKKGASIQEVREFVQSQLKIIAKKYKQLPTSSDLPQNLRQYVSCMAKSIKLMNEKIEHYNHIIIHNRSLLSRIRFSVYAFWRLPIEVSISLMNEKSAKYEKNLDNYFYGKSLFSRICGIVHKIRIAYRFLNLSIYAEEIENKKVRKCIDQDSVFYKKMHMFAPVLKSAKTIAVLALLPSYKEKGVSAQKATLGEMARFFKEQCANMDRLSVDELQELEAIGQVLVLRNIIKPQKQQSLSTVASLPKEQAIHEAQPTSILEASPMDDSPPDAPPMDDSVPTAPPTNNLHATKVSAAPSLGSVVRSSPRPLASQGSAPIDMLSELRKTIDLRNKRKTEIAKPQVSTNPPTDTSKQTPLMIALKQRLDPQRVVMQPVDEDDDGEWDP